MLMEEGCRNSILKHTGHLAIAGLMYVDWIVVNRLR